MSTRTAFGPRGVIGALWLGAVTVAGWRPTDCFSGGTPSGRCAAFALRQARLECDGQAVVRTRGGAFL